MAEKENTPPNQPLELRTETREALLAAVEQAFDYRGDVTIRTADGSHVEGFVFNRMVEGIAEPFLEYYPKNSDDQKRLPLKDIKGIVLSGADPAAGRSWETWVKKHQEKMKAQAEGKDIGNIEPEALPLDD